MNRAACLLCLFLLPLSSPAQGSTNIPDLVGYITRISSATDFDVAGTHVLTSTQTSYGIRNHKQSLSTRTPLPLFLGQTVDVFGKRDRKHHTVAAESVFVHPQSPLPVSGAGIVDSSFPHPPSLHPPSPQNKFFAQTGTSSAYDPAQRSPSFPRSSPPRPSRPTSGSTTTVSSRPMAPSSSTALNFAQTRSKRQKTSSAPAASTTRPPSIQT